MGVLEFDHVNIKTSRLDELVRFYVDVMGLKSGPRPDFPFRGAWLYLGAKPILHLVEVAPPTGATERGYGLEHFAFRGSNVEEFRGHLTAAGVSFRERSMTGSSQIQLVFCDPEGNRLHVDFALP